MKILQQNLNIAALRFGIYGFFMFFVFCFFKVCNDFTYYLGNEANDSSNWLEPSLKKKKNLKVAAKNHENEYKSCLIHLNAVFSWCSLV